MTERQIGADTEQKTDGDRERERELEMEGEKDRGKRETCCCFSPPVPLLRLSKQLLGPRVPLQIISAFWNQPNAYLGLVAELGRVPYI